MPCSQAEEEGEAMGAIPVGSAVCVGVAFRQDPRGFWGNPWGLTGWIVRNGIGVAPLWVELCRNVSAEQDRAGPRLRHAVDADRGQALRP